jgi:DNA-binding transcriptional MerR regulator/methylmalonyl-CoA mutase cobalamin-binding subunit
MRSIETSMDPVGRYKMGTFSRLTGFSAAVLRAWERRYGLLQPQRLPGGHRLYTDDDLQVIRRVGELLRSGCSIGEVALRGRDAMLRGADASDVEVAAEGTPSVRSASLAALCDLVIRAAAEIDGDLLRRALDETFARVTPRIAVESVIVPAAREIGARWARGEVSIAGEHLVSAHLAFRLKNLLESANMMGRDNRPVLCACLPGEHHELGLLIVALRLASNGHHLLYLGPNVPFDDLEQACQQVNPLAVCLSVTRFDTLVSARAELVGFAQRLSGYLSVHVGGSGVPDTHQELQGAGVRLWPADRELEELLAAIALEKRSPRVNRSSMH